MSLDRSLQYVYRIGSDNQVRLHWTGQSWRYEFLAGSVVFDEQTFADERQLMDALSMHGLSLDKFKTDASGEAQAYSASIQQKIDQLTKLGIAPCSKHGLTSKNIDGTCEACQNTDYPDDFKGTEG